MTKQPIILKDDKACNHECRKEDEPCGKRFIDTAHFYCTRDKGHAGPHSACGMGDDEHNLRVWLD